MSTSNLQAGTAFGKKYMTASIPSSLNVLPTMAGTGHTQGVSQPWSDTVLLPVCSCFTTCGRRAEGQMKPMGLEQGWTHLLPAAELSDRFPWAMRARPPWVLMWVRTGTAAWSLSSLGCLIPGSFLESRMQRCSCCRVRKEGEHSSPSETHLEWQSAPRHWTACQCIDFELKYLHCSFSSWGFLWSLLFR